MALPPRLLSAATTVWKKVPGTTRGGKAIWLWHLLAIIGLWMLLRHWKVPAVWESDVHTPKPHTFNEVYRMGIWRGGITHIIISLICLLTVKWWSSARTVRRETKLTTGLPGGHVWFWPLLAIIVALGFGVRWSRMDHSYWGDEGWAVRHYVHGEWEPKDGSHDYQGELVFAQVPWQRVILSDQTGGNHFLFSILQRLTLDAWRWMNGLPAWAFDETISRLPVLAAGVGSILALGCFLRWLGRPVAGLFGALFLALHPWHIRYSTEGRGYILMVLFFTLALWALFWALRDGRWRCWASFAAAQFLAVYSWKVAALPLAEASALAAVWVLIGKADRLPQKLATVGRIFVSGATMTALFALLYSAPSLQAPRALERLKHTGKPMNHVWLTNSLTGLLMGTPWYRAAKDNPTEVPLREACKRTPLATYGGIAAALALLGIGAARLWRTQAMQLVLCLAIIGGAVLGASIFKWVMGIEWIFWYSFFVILPLAFLHAIGAEWLLGKGLYWLKHRPRGSIALIATGLLLPLWSHAVAIPQIRLMDTQPYESNREAFQLTRGQHEPWNFSGPSPVKTCYLWRHIFLYDPRADTHVHEASTLRALMAKADATPDGQLYYVVGNRLLFRDGHPELTALLDDPTLFEKTHTLWAEEEVHTLELFRYKKPASPKP